MTATRTGRPIITYGVAVLAAVLALAAVIFYPASASAQATEVSINEADKTYLTVLVLLVLFALGYLAGRIR